MHYAAVYSVGGPKLRAINMMASAANGAKLISNSVVPTPMAMYFMVIFPCLMSAPASDAAGIVVIEATLKRRRSFTTGQVACNLCSIYGGTVG